MKRVIFLKIGTGFFAVETDQVKCFIDNAKILNYSDRRGSHGIVGLLRFYDEMIPVLDIHKWFGLERIEICNKTVFLIMTCRGKSFSFPISGAKNIAEVSSDCFCAIPSGSVQESVNVFEEVIEMDGTLYLKIDAENVLREMTANTEIS